jgi:cell division transport system permease protein
MQLRYVYSELGQGLRRNLTMHLAVILTLVVSLTLVGIGLLFQQQATRAADHFGNQLQITVYLCRLNDSNPVCPNPVTEAQKTEIEAVVDATRRSRAIASSPARSPSRRPRSSTARSCSPARTPR